MVYVVWVKEEVGERNLVGLYDESLLQKLKYWIGDNNIHILGPNDTRRLWEITADIENDNPVSLPLITLRRSGGYTINVKQKRPITYDGYTRGATLEKSVQLNAIPITVDYQIDVYTRYLNEADEFTRNLIFNIINYPTLTVQIPYENMGLTHHAQIRITSEVEDNSDIPERLIPGQFTRMTIGIDIDDAYLWDVRVRNNVNLSISMQDGEELTPIITNHITELKQEIQVEN